MAKSNNKKNKKKKKEEDRMSNRTRQKHKRADREMESDDALRFQT